jgi:hypothetical protein
MGSRKNNSDTKKSPVQTIQQIFGLQYTKKSPVIGAVQNYVLLLQEVACNNINRHVVLENIEKALTNKTGPVKVSDWKSEVYKWQNLAIRLNIEKYKERGTLISDIDIARHELLLKNLINALGDSMSDEKGYVSLDKARQTSKDLLNSFCPQKTVSGKSSFGFGFKKTTTRNLLIAAIVFTVLMAPTLYLRQIKIAMLFLFIAALLWTVFAEEVRIEACKQW